MSSNLRHYLTKAFFVIFGNHEQQQTSGKGVQFLIEYVLPLSPVGVAILNKILASHCFQNILPSIFFSHFFSCFLLGKRFISLDFPVLPVQKFSFNIFMLYGKPSLLIFKFLFSAIPYNFKSFNFVFKFFSFSSSAMPCTFVLQWQRHRPSPCYFSGSFGVMANGTSHYTPFSQCCRAHGNEPASSPLSTGTPSSLLMRLHVGYLKKKKATFQYNLISHLNFFYVGPVYSQSCQKSLQHECAISAAISQCSSHFGPKSNIPFSFCGG